MKYKRILVIVTILIFLFINAFTVNADYIYSDWSTNLDFVVVNRKARIVAYRGDDGILNIPSSIVYGGGYSVFGIESAAFDYCDNIVTLKGGYYNMVIMSSAFKGSTSLKNVDFKAQEIDYNAFYDCSALENVKLKSIKIIATEAFNNCAKLREITLNKSIIQIGENAFWGCNSLTDVYYNGTLEEKNAINIESGNEALLNAKWHFEICENNGHTYDGECDAECEVCGEKRKITHAWNTGEITKKATCKENGIKTYTCDNCSETKEEIIDKNNNHTFSSWNKTKTPSCTENGKELRTCSICKKEEIRDISALGHTLGEWQVIENATCIKTGLQLRNCNNCTYFETKMINAKGHNYSKGWTIDISATCSTTGIKSHHCLKCDSKIELTNIQAIGHKFGDWKTVKEPTVKTTGEAERKCKNVGCSEIETKTIAKLAEDGHTHKFGGWKVEEKATCTKNGKNVRKCTICSETESVVVLSSGHNFNEWQIEKQVTCEEDGSMIRTCKNCDINEKDIVLHTGHMFDEITIIEEATHEKDGLRSLKCIVCGKTKEENYSITSLDKDKNSDNSSLIKEDNKLTWIYITVFSVLLIGVMALIIIRIKRKTIK